MTLKYHKHSRDTIKKLTLHSEHADWLMMTSWHGNTFRILALCDGIHQIPFNLANDAFGFSLWLAKTNNHTNSLSRRWYKTPWCSCVIIAMVYCGYLGENRLGYFNNPIRSRNTMALVDCHLTLSTGKIRQKRYALFNDVFKIDNISQKASIRLCGSLRLEAFKWQFNPDVCFLLNSLQGIHKGGCSLERELPW